LVASNDVTKILVSWPQVSIEQLKLKVGKFTKNIRVDNVREIFLFVDFVVNFFVVGTAESFSDQSLDA